MRKMFIDVGSLYGPLLGTYWGHLVLESVLRDCLVAGIKGGCVVMVQDIDMSRPSWTVTISVIFLNYCLILHITNTHRTIILMGNGTILPLHLYGALIEWSKNIWIL